MLQMACPSRGVGGAPTPLLSSLPGPDPALDSITHQVWLLPPLEIPPPPIVLIHAITPSWKHPSSPLSRSPPDAALGAPSSGTAETPLLPKRGSSSGSQRRAL